MSIWTSETVAAPRSGRSRAGCGRRLAAVLATLALLPGCLLAGFGQGRAIETVTVTRGEVTIAGPRGFCIDPASLRDTAEGAFALLASCAALAGGSGPQPAIPGVLSAMVSAEPEGVGLARALRDIEGYLASEAGRTALSRTGDAQSVQVLDSRITRGILFLNIRDDSAFDGPEIEPEYWRAIFAVNDHIVTLSVMQPEGQPATGALATLEAFIARLRSENAGSSHGTQASAPGPATAPAMARRAG